MLARVRALIVVAILVSTIGMIPGLTPAAHAQPRTITVATYNLEPFVFNRGGIRSGFTIDVLDEIGKRTGWNFKYVDVDDPSSPALLKAVIDGRADAGACAISVTSDRADIVDFSQPMMSAGLQIMVPAGTTQRTQPGLIDFLKLLFSKSMLVWFFAALVLTIVPAHIIWLLERRVSHSNVSKSYFPGIFQAFEWGLGMLSAAPVDEPRRWLTKTVTVVWTFVSLIFVAYYTAILTANLTVEKIDARISTPEDLIGKSVCTVNKSTTSDYLKDLGLRFDGKRTIEECFAGMRDKRFDAIVFDAPVLEYYLSIHGAGDAELVGPTFKPRDYGIAFRIGSDLRRQVDDALLSIREDGTFDQVTQKWFGSDR